jgi:hypothetical protein
LWAEAVELYRAARRKQPRGNLPLHLTGEAAQATALQHQETRRIQTEVDALAGIIGKWLNIPVLKAILDGADPRFTNLNETGEELIVRDQVSQVEIWVDCLGKEETTYRRNEALVLARAMRLVGGWELGNNHRTARFGLQKMWRRSS